MTQRTRFFNELIAGHQKRHMATISAFADEIDPSLDVQMDVCASHGIRHIDLRSIDGVNVSKFTDPQARQYAARLAGRGFAVACIGSPLGKIHIDEDLDAHLDLTRRCCELANLFATGYVRVFSFYGPEGGRIADHRETVIDMLSRMAAVAAAGGVVLLHENEKNIYGARPEGVKDIFAAVGGESFRGIFDPSNYIEEHVDPLAAWRDGLSELTEYFHIKDKVSAEAPTCVPAGEGIGKIEPILADAKAHGFNGYLTLEPHMSQAGQFAGFSGPDRFGKAVAGLKNVCDRVGIGY